MEKNGGPKILLYYKLFIGIIASFAVAGTSSGAEIPIKQQPVQYVDSTFQISSLVYLENLGYHQVRLTDAKPNNNKQYTFETNDVHVNLTTYAQNKQQFRAILEVLGEQVRQMAVQSESHSFFFLVGRNAEGLRISEFPFLKLHHPDFVFL